MATEIKETLTVKVRVDVFPFGTLRATERVDFVVPADAERETITSPRTTAACESVPAVLPYVLR